MKITLDIPDNAQSDLMKLAVKLDLPLEKVTASCLAAGCQVIDMNPKFQTQIKKQWKGEGK